MGYRDTEFRFSVEPETKMEEVPSPAPPSPQGWSSDSQGPILHKGGAVWCQHGAGQYQKAHLNESASWERHPRPTCQSHFCKVNTFIQEPLSALSLNSRIRSTSHFTGVQSREKKLDVEKCTSFKGLRNGEENATILLWIHSAWDTWLFWFWWEAPLCC